MSFVDARLSPQSCGTKVLRFIYLLLSLSLSPSPSRVDLFTYLLSTYLDLFELFAIQYGALYVSLLVGPKIQTERERDTAERG